MHLAESTKASASCADGARVGGPRGISMRDCLLAVDGRTSFLSGALPCATGAPCSTNQSRDWSAATGSVQERIRAIARSKTPAVSASKWVIIPPMSSLKPNERISCRRYANEAATELKHSNAVVTPSTGQQNCTCPQSDRHQLGSRVRSHHASPAEI